MSPVVDGKVGNAGARARSRMRLPERIAALHCQIALVGIRLIEPVEEYMSPVGFAALLSCWLQHRFHARMQRRRAGIAGLGACKEARTTLEIDTPCPPLQLQRFLRPRPREGEHRRNRLDVPRVEPDQPVALGVAQEANALVIERDRLEFEGRQVVPHATR